MFRDPLGYPQWFEKGLPTAKSDHVGQPLVPEKDVDVEPVIGWGLAWTLVGVFVGGMALNLTPCVYPIIPVTVSYFAGQSGKSTARLVAHGLSYVLGLALTNSILGVSAALTGGLMGAALQHPAVLAGISTVLIAFATSLFGFWELRLPFAVTQVAARSYAGYFGSLFMGLAMGAVAAPCIGPFVLGLLTWVAAQGSVVLGFSVFFTLSLGLGLPLFVLALFSGHIGKLPRSGTWMLWIRSLMGWVLVAMAVYYLRALLPKNVHTILMASVAAAAGLHLGWLAKIQTTSAAFRWLRSAAGAAGMVIATLIIGSWILRGPAVDWAPYSGDLMESARQDGRPVILDFYADWCTPCVELDRLTFHDPGIVARSRGKVTMVKIDLTRGNDAVHDRLLRDYDVKGVPTVVFIGTDGKERKDLRIVDFLPADQFLNRIDSLLTFTKTETNGG